MADLQVRFSTTTFPLVLPPDFFTVPETSDSDQLNAILSALLTDLTAANEDSAAEAPAIPRFDLFIDHQPLRGTLAEHVAAAGKSRESVIEIEYTQAAEAPKRTSTNQHPDWVSSVAFLDDALIATACYDGAVRVWSKQGLAAELKVHENIVKSVATVDATHFLSASKDRSVRLHTFSSSASSLTNTALYLGHEDSVESLAVSPDATRFVSGSWDKTVKIWAVDTEEDALDNEEQNVEEDAKRRKAKRAKKEQPSVVKEARLAPCFNTLDGHLDVVSALLWPTMDVLFSGSHDHSIRSWDAASGDCLSVWNSGFPIHGLSYSAVSQRIASAHTDRYVRIWDARVQSGNVAKVAVGPHRERCVAVAWSPTNEHVLCSAALDGRVRFWDIRARNAPLATVHAHEGKALACAWRGDQIATGGEDGKVKLYTYKK